MPEDIAEALAALAKIGHQGLKEGDLPGLFGPDPYEEELIVMAETSAYFHIVYKVSSPPGTTSVRRQNCTHALKSSSA